VNHQERCRQRLEALIATDPANRVRMERADDRLTRWLEQKEEREVKRRRASGPEPAGATLDCRQPAASQPPPDSEDLTMGPAPSAGHSLASSLKRGGG